MARVVVIGAGIIGLSTATCIQKSSDVQVSIVAENLSPHTTSDGAFGIWEPHVVGHDKRVELVSFFKSHWN